MIDQANLPRTGDRTRPGERDDLSGWRDEDLLAAIRTGETEPFAELWRRYQPTVRRYAASLRGGRDADDVVADAFVKVLHAVRRGKGPVDNPVRYLMVAARTVSLDAGRSEARTAPVADEGEQDRTVLDRASGPEEARLDDDLRTAFGSLSPTWARVIWWTEVEGRDVHEVADALGISPPAASALAYRARRALRAAYCRPAAGSGRRTASASDTSGRH